MHLCEFNELFRSIFDACAKVDLEYGALPEKSLLMIVHVDFWLYRSVQSHLGGSVRSVPYPIQGYGG